ncbi:hypothetical protein DFH11DRAFT_1544726 [Phellopilus nigrolimitatus]|nr:hypothetical protein DFH11DRAFT_1731251 [Phellopilus nigrolimitatus]KAH8113478.1 hypothetical protein DFH11DRAFT_1544726 [Phellopilus nigrolimitatus]
MSSALRPSRDEVRAGATDEARTFKKTEQVYGRPQVTDHDMHLDALRSPPRNVSEDAQPGGTVPGMKAPKNDEFYADERPEGVMGEDIAGGRKKVADVQNQLIDDSESTSRA